MLTGCGAFFCLFFCFCGPHTGRPYVHGTLHLKLLFCKQNYHLFQTLSLSKAPPRPNPPAAAMAAMPPDELSVWKTCQSADFADTKIERACVCVRVWEMLNCRQQYVPQYPGFDRQARSCPVIFCPRLPFRAKSNRKTNKKEKNKQKKSCSMRLWLGRVWLFLCRSLMTGHLFYFIFFQTSSLSYVCLSWILWTPATGPNTGTLWRVSVRFCTLLLHFPIHQVLNRKGIYWEHIPLM